MREFFQGRKRKVGVAMLVVACVSAAGWARSTMVADAIIFPVIKTRGDSEIAGTCIGMMSTRSALLLTRLPIRNDEIAVLDHIFPHWRSSQNLTGIEGPEYERQWEQFGFSSYSIYLARSEYGQVNWFVFPYWPIVIVLTVLSVHLLLNNPQTGQPKPASEP